MGTVAHKSLADRRSGYREQRKPLVVQGTSDIPAGMHERLTGQLGRVVAEYADWTDYDIQVVGSPTIVRTTEYRLIATGVDSDGIHHDPLY